MLCISMSNNDRYDSILMKAAYMTGPDAGLFNGVGGTKGVFSCVAETLEFDSFDIGNM